MFLTTILILAIASVAGGHRGGSEKLSLSVSSSGFLTEDMLTEELTIHGPNLAMATSPSLDKETFVSNATHVHAVDHNPELVWQRSNPISTDVLSTSLLNLSHGHPRRGGELQRKMGARVFVLKHAQSVWTCDTDALSSGSFGSVHVGEDSAGSPVVVKLVTKWDPGCSNNAFEEFDKQQKVKSEYVAVVYEVFVLQTSQWAEFPSGKTWCIVMEKLHTDLDKIIKGDARSKQPHAIIGNADVVKRIWSMALVAVMKVHEQGMIFRDIKAQNILVTKGSVSDMIAKLTDFGIAIYHYDKIKTEEVHYPPCGTPYYYSPELIDGEAYGAANDAWALGVLLYFLYYGKQPFDAKNVQGLFQKIENGRKAVSFPEPLPPPPMKELIENLLETNPTKRRCIRQFDSPTEHLSKELISHHPWVKDTVDELMQKQVDHPMHEDRELIALGTPPRGRSDAETALSTPPKDLREQVESAAHVKRTENNQNPAMRALGAMVAAPNHMRAAWNRKFG